MKDLQWVRSAPLPLRMFVEGFVYVEIEVTATPAGTAELYGICNTYSSAEPRGLRVLHV